MKTHQKKKIVFISSLLFFAQLITTNTSANDVTLPRTACHIEVGNAHLSTYIKRTRGLDAVKVNATSTCNFTQRSVQLTVKIFKVGAVADYLVAQESTKPLATASTGRVVKNQFTFLLCKTSKKSFFYGIAFSQAIIKGKRYITLPVRSEDNVPLDCGN